jgi:hypothetical protein
MEQIPYRSGAPEAPFRGFDPAGGKNEGAAPESRPSGLDFASTITDRSPA